MATAAQAIVLEALTKKPGLFSLGGKLVERVCQKGLEGYFKKLGAAVDGLDLGKLANQPAPLSRHSAEMAMANLLRGSLSDGLKDILKTNIYRAMILGFKQGEIMESGVEDEDRDNSGRWTAGGGSASSKALKIAGVVGIAALGLSGAKTLIGTPYSVMSCSVFACAITGRKHEWAPELYKQGKPGKVEDAKDGDIVAFNGTHVAVMTKDGLMDSIPERGVGFVDWSKVSKSDPWYKGPVHIVPGKPLGEVKEAEKPEIKTLDLTGPVAQEAAEYAERKAAELVTGINNTTKQKIADAVATGIEDRLGVDGLGKLIRGIVQDMEGLRAATIASTEMNSAMSFATVQKLERIGIEYKVWIIADDDADEICTGNADQGPIPVGDTFESGDSYPPAHPNCRCAVSGARAPEEE